MIFASDLDQTLIYSENFLGKHYTSGERLKDHQLKIIEYYQGEPLSYIHQEVIELLQEITHKHHFIPVTTRTEEQYKRIDFCGLNIHPTYAVTTNGAKVLVDGQADKDWQQIVRQGLEQCTLSIQEVIEIVKKYFSTDQIIKVRVAEDTFVYCLLNMAGTPLEYIEGIRQYFSNDEWKISLQGRKLYFMPRVVSKGDAMTYLCKKLGEDHYLAAGDSLLDIPLLRAAKEGYIPAHGEIYDQKLWPKYNFNLCSAKGINASLEIVKSISEKEHL